jgi:hypothetical protein
MSTGPTGTDVDTLLSIINTGLTGNALAEYNMMMNQPMPGPMPGPTVVDPSILAMFPNVATGPVEPPHIVSLEELMASHSAVIAKEHSDLQLLNTLISPSRQEFRAQLFQWAAAGFPDLYIIQSYPITPPDICSDGVTRGIGKYIEYLIGVNLGEVIDALKALMVGINPSWSTNGNTLRIHVTKS